MKTHSHRVGIRTYSDYCPFHAPLSGRTLYKTNSTLDYRYGVSNGLEKTEEVSGNGNQTLRIDLAVLLVGV
jgi:hypothetical protein